MESIKAGQRYRVVDPIEFGWSCFNTGSTFTVEGVDRDGDGIIEDHIGGYLTRGHIESGCVELISEVSNLTPRSLGCFEEVANVIGEDAAEYELQRVIGCDLVGEEWRERKTIATFIWSDTPQGSGFWFSVNDGEYPENYQPPKAQPKENTMIKPEDLKSGMLVELSSRRLCIVIGDYLYNEDWACISFVSDFPFNGVYSAEKVYGITEYIQLPFDTSRRDVIWERKSPEQKAREEMVERIEAYFPEKAGVISYEEVAEFVLECVVGGSEDNHEN